MYLGVLARKGSKNLSSDAVNQQERFHHNPFGKVVENPQRLYVELRFWSGKI